MTSHGESRRPQSTAQQRRGAEAGPARGAALWELEPVSMPRSSLGGAVVAQPRQPPAVTRVTTGEMIGHELRRETEEEARHIVKEAQNAYLEEHKKSIISNRRVR